MRSKLFALTCAAVLAAATGAAAHGFHAFGFSFDFGLFRDNQLEAHSERLFGINRAVPRSSTTSLGATDANANPAKLITVARGLHVRVVTSQPNAGPNIDQMVLWPNDQFPTHLIVANEEGTAQAALQRIRLSDGLVETIIASGLTSSDPVRLSPWGTILLGEEATDGWLLEILDPLHTTGVTFNRATGVSSDPAHVAGLPAVGHLAFESIALYPNGVMYYGDENRPGTGTAGGAYFKFIPTTLWTGGTITSLAQSPLTSGKIYGLRLGKRSGNTDYGQGTQAGLGTWIQVATTPNAMLRALAATNKLTGYYRPEDAEIDPEDLAQGNVRFCANNTGNEAQDFNWGETICVTDGTVAEAGANTAIPEVQYLVLGSWDLAMADNIAFQPGRGNFLIQEDGDGAEFGRNNDIWSCLDDGDDVDDQSDGCVRVATLNDLTAESTGGVFNKWGNHYYVSIQHNITGHGVVVDITGW